MTITTPHVVTGQTTQSDSLVDVLIQAIEASGFSPSGPTDHRVAEHGEPMWVCNARAQLAQAYASDVAQ